MKSLQEPQEKSYRLSRKGPFIQSVAVFLVSHKAGFQTVVVRCGMCAGQARIIWWISIQLILFQRFVTAASTDRSLLELVSPGRRGTRATSGPVLRHSHTCTVAAGRGVPCVFPVGCFLWCAGEREELRASQHGGCSGPGCGIFRALWGWLKSACFAAGVTGTRVASPRGPESLTRTESRRLVPSAWHTRVAWNQARGTTRLVGWDRNAIVEA